MSVSSKNINVNISLEDTIDESMLFRYFTAPPITRFPLQWLRMS